MNKIIDLLQKKLDKFDILSNQADDYKQICFYSHAGRRIIQVMEMLKEIELTYGNKKGGLK